MAKEEVAKPDYDREIKNHFTGDKTLAEVYVFGDGSYTFSKAIAEKNAADGIKFTVKTRNEILEAKKEEKKKKEK